MSHGSSGKGGVTFALVGSLLAHAVVLSLVAYVPALTRPTRVQIPPRPEPIVVEVFLDAEGFESEPTPEPEPEPPSPEEVAQADSPEVPPAEETPPPEEKATPAPKVETTKRPPAPSPAPAKGSEVAKAPTEPPPEPVKPTQPAVIPEDTKTPSGETMAGLPKGPAGTADGSPEGIGQGQGKGPSTTANTGEGTNSGGGESKPTKPANTQTVASWTSALGQRVQKGLPYPPSAEEDGSEGTVMLNLSVAADGALVDVSVAKTSGDRRLDEAALRRIRQLAPFSAPPEGALVFRLPIVFKLPS